MELATVDGTSWDVLIVGTGLHESLLALALSRSGKNILHVDQNGYYGGSSAALSLQDAEKWATKYSSQDPSSIFANASITIPQKEQSDQSNQSTQLGFSRAYSLALAPQIIYAQSAILPSLVSSKVDSQLEFVAVGSCYVFALPGDGIDTSDPQSDATRGSLLRVPSSREDIFADESLESKQKRGLMKFIKFIIDFEDQTALWEENQSTPFDEFLYKNFNLSPSVQRPLQALTLSLSLPHNTETKFAVPRIARHLRSIGVFGPGFGSVLPKWGGLAEIAQVGCRACAVGGGVYMLGNGIENLEPPADSNKDSAVEKTLTSKKWRVKLQNCETVSTDWIASGYDSLSSEHRGLLSGIPEIQKKETKILSRLIAIVSSPLDKLFSQTAEGSPAPAVAVIQCPNSNVFSSSSNKSSWPIHLMAHSSDTGECPAGHCIIYGSIACGGDPGYSLLDDAVASLLKAIGDEGQLQILWKLIYEQRSDSIVSDKTQAEDRPDHQNAVLFPPPSLDLAYDDQVLRDVRRAWQRVMGTEATDFMTFDARDGLGADDEDQ